jgi:hypothetical protein
MSRCIHVSSHDPVRVSDAARVHGFWIFITTLDTENPSDSPRHASPRQMSEEPVVARGIFQHCVTSDDVHHIVSTVITDFLRENFCSSNHGIRLAMNCWKHQPSFVGSPSIVDVRATLADQSFDRIMMWYDHVPMYTSQSRMHHLLDIVYEHVCATNVAFDPVASQPSNAIYYGGRAFVKEFSKRYPDRLFVDADMEFLPPCHRQYEMFKLRVDPSLPISIGEVCICVNECYHLWYGYLSAMDADARNPIDHVSVPDKCEDVFKMTTTVVNHLKRMKQQHNSSYSLHIYLPREWYLAHASWEDLKRDIAEKTSTKNVRIYMEGVLLIDQQLALKRHHNVSCTFRAPLSEELVARYPAVRSSDALTHSQPNSGIIVYTHQILNTPFTMTHIRSER